MPLRPRLWVIAVVSWLASTQAFFLTVTIVEIVVAGHTPSEVIGRWMTWTTRTSMPVWMLVFTIPPALVGFCAGAAARKPDRRPLVPILLSIAVAGVIPALFLLGYALTRR
ncbi:MAG: hypothetical protein WBC44_00115 [Planctomycetaceae bacterium]